MKEIIYGIIAGLLVGLMMIGFATSKQYINMKVDALSEAIVNYISVEESDEFQYEAEIYNV